MDGSSRKRHKVDVFLPNYKLGKKIGIGSFGKVKVAEHALTGHKVAIKILKLDKIKKNGTEEKVRREIEIHRLLTHPHVIRLYEVVETPAHICLVMEYAKSGELFDYIMEKGRQRDDQARKFFQQIISGVEYCHGNMVVHRDLKPENLLLDSECSVKIADFGLSNVSRDGHLLTTSCGSPNYSAPEVISGKPYSGPGVDVWSCGVILYALVCANLPFEDPSIPVLFKKIKGGTYTLPSYLSPGVKDLISRMLVVDPRKRITIPVIRQHPWFQPHLPRYLAPPPPGTTQQADEVQAEVLERVIEKGFDRDRLLESLGNRAENEGTVAYYLLLDNRSHVSGGYDFIGARFQETIKVEGVSPMPPGHVPVERKWALGLQSRAHPLVIMTGVLKALQQLNVGWEKMGSYSIKCWWLHHLFGDEPTIVENDALKFELQLYKAREGEDKYLVDLQRVEGPQLLFLDLCSAFLSQLKLV